MTEEVTDEWMQKVAMEMNLSETAFLLKVDNGYNLRWFTPNIEVDLCGHATLASAHILWAISLVILHTIITSAVKQGVTEANHELIEAVRAIERKLDSK